MRVLRFLTHADVVIDPSVPVPNWPLSERGVARHRSFAERTPAPVALWSSMETKAQDGADVMAEVWGLTPHRLEPLAENDRSSTGYLPKASFEAMADAFFASPTLSVKGWERAVDAQVRIVSAVQTVLDRSPRTGEIMIVAHGGVGALLRAYALGASIDRSHDQPAGNGGAYLKLSLPDWTLLEDWTVI